MKKTIILCAVALFAISAVNASDSVSVDICKNKNYFVMDFGAGMHTEGLLLAIRNSTNGVRHRT